TFKENKIIQQFESGSNIQSPNVVDSENIEINYVSNSVPLFVSGTNIEYEIMKEIIDYNNCVWSHIPGTSDEYKWDCQYTTFSIKNPFEFPIKNIRLNFPDGRKFFVPVLEPNGQPNYIGLCVKNRPSSHCVIFENYFIEKYPNIKPCYDFYYTQDNNQYLRLDKIIPLECN
ncbi:MAG: hypothetical protein ACFFG0_47665, partial [Candidatus Thorarchaeota archaeon]